MSTSLQTMSEQAGELRDRGRLEEAIALFAKAAREYPESAVAEHNLASVLGDAGRAGEAETHIRRAFAKGLNAPESWLVLARALLAQTKLEAAEEAFVRATALNPGMIEAQYELAQLIWMTSGDSAAALAPLDRTIATHPDQRALHATRARVLMYTRGPLAAFGFVTSTLERWPDDTVLLKTGIDAAIAAGEPEAALRMSDRLVALQPDTRSARVFRVYALLAADRGGEALPIAEAMHAAEPDDQHALSLFATACRMLGDDRYRALYDYGQFVRTYTLATPDGWSSLPAYLADLGAALRARHPFKTHPFSNSEENGSKISDVLEIDVPAVQAFRQAMDPAVDAHLDYLGAGDDVVRSRNTGRWDIDGIWSVWLKPNGFHHNHVHPAAWISSACYVEVPQQVDAGGREGWIQFGEPGLVTNPKLEAEFAVKPEPGMLVLFPSYLWHGTVPFGGDQPRLTIAFDIVPAGGN